MAWAQVCNRYIAGFGWSAKHCCLAKFFNCRKESMRLEFQNFLNSLYTSVVSKHSGRLENL